MSGIFYFKYIHWRIENTMSAVNTPNHSGLYTSAETGFI